MDTKVARSMAGAADIDSSDPTKVVPRNDVDVTKDFSDIWFVGDYSDDNTGDNAGFIAIRVINALSTGGFKLQSTDKGKGNLFWRSVNLTGNQTTTGGRSMTGWFWRSVNLTGNQTQRVCIRFTHVFWRSVNLTGNQTSLSSLAM